MLDRLRARFAKHECCESTCDSCASTTAPVIKPTPAAAPPSERLKMPKGVDAPSGKQTTAPAAPLLTPAGAKIETETKNPF